MTPDEIRELPMGELQERLPKRQFYTIRMVAEKPMNPSDPHMHALMREHLLFLHELEMTGVLLASGPLRDERNQWDGTGMAVIRADSIAEATAIAEREPLHRAGMRRNEVGGWQISELSLSLSVRLLDGSFTLS